MNLGATHSLAPEFMPIFFTRKRTKHENTTPTVILGAQSINTKPELLIYIFLQRPIFFFYKFQGLSVVRTLFLQKNKKKRLNPKAFFL